MNHGSVYIEAEGEARNLEKFLDWCRLGPEGAKVEKIEISDSPFKNFAEIERDFIDF
jgi:acylphosphatase